MGLFDTTDTVTQATDNVAKKMEKAQKRSAYMKKRRGEVNLAVKVVSDFISTLPKEQVPQDVTVALAKLTGKKGSTSNFEKLFGPNPAVGDSVSAQTAFNTLGFGHSDMHKLCYQCKKRGIAIDFNTMTLTYTITALPQ